MLLSIPCGLPSVIKARIAAGRVDFVGIGDSNQLHGNGSIASGHDYAWRSALGMSYPMYATGLFSIGFNGGNGVSFDYAYTQYLGSTLAYSGAPAGLDAYLNFGTDNNPHFYGYTSTDVSTGQVVGLAIQPGVAIDTASDLFGDYYYGTFSTGSGAFRPSIRLTDAPYTILAAAPSSISTNDGVGSNILKTTLELTFSAGRKGVQFEWTPAGVSGITAPFFGTYQRARTTKPTGFAYTTLYGNGGHDTRQMALTLQAAPLATLTHFFSILRNDQGVGQKTIVITLNSGGNDNGDYNSSVGTNPASSHTWAGFTDNLLAIKTVIDGVWTSNSWPSNELFYLVDISHPEIPELPLLPTLRANMPAFAANYANMQYLGYIDLFGASDFQANSLYYPDGGTAHLTAAGYEQLGIMNVGLMR